ncbi:MAG: hypothetical protein GY699_14985, partial [Desulfobacteraceae bacterium]|nr:hypothetical protein [Desulfobacteraceae bacterium]
MKKLHFYPGDRLLILYNIGKVLIKVNAVGGPRKVIKDWYMDETPTDHGNYIIYGAQKYHTSTWQDSKIKWGT